MSVQVCVVCVCFKLLVALELSHTCFLGIPTYRIVKNIDGKKVW